MNNIRNIFYSKNNDMILDIKYISLINSLSSSIKELFNHFSKIISDINTCIQEQNNYIISSQYLINEINNKKDFKQIYQNLIRNIEGINNTNNLIHKSFINFDDNASLFFQKAKIIFKRMKDLQNSNKKIISERNNKYQNKLNSLPTKRNNSMISFELNNYEPENFINKNNNIQYNSNRKSNNINLNINKKKLNIFEKKPRNKKYEINTNDIIYLSKKIITGKNNKKYINHSQDEIITNVSGNNLIKKNILYNTSPKKKSSWSKDKKIHIIKYNDSSSRYDDNTISQIYNKSNKISAKKKRYNSIKLNTFSEYDINTNFIEFLNNIIEYFYLLKISQHNIFIESTKINPEKDINLKLNQSLIKLNYSIFMLEDFFKNNNELKRKLNYIINQKENIEQKLKNLIFNIKNNQNDNNINIFDNNKDNLKNLNKSDYIKSINKLRNDNQSLANINQKIIAENKLLLSQLSLYQKAKIKDFNNNDNLGANTDKNDMINKILKENREYSLQLNKLKKRNSELLSLIKAMKNNKDSKTNSSYFLNNSQISNIINYNTDINNNSYLTKERPDIKNMKNLVEENKIIKNKLNEKEEKYNNIIKINEDLKNKSKNYLSIINEKESIIKNLNLNINKLKNEINNKENNLNEITTHCKEEIENLKKNKENEESKLKLLIDEKNNEIKLLNAEILITKEKIINFNDKTQQLNELQNSNKNLEKEKTDLLEKTEQQTKEINQLESIINVLNEKIKLLGKNENTEIINNINNKEQIKDNNQLKSNKNSDNFVNDNNEINKKRLSTPSFKSPVEDIDQINELKKINEQLLNKIDNYESILKNKGIEIANDINTNKISNSNLIKKSIIDLGNNYISTISSMKINKLYSSSDYKILSDVSYLQLKWYLLKKKNEEDEEENEYSYDNLIWVPLINIIDLSSFEYNEIDNNSELFKLIKKLEEKEKIISKLSYNLEKIEKESELISSNNININNIPEDHISPKKNILKDSKKIIKHSHIKTQEASTSSEKHNNLKFNKTEKEYSNLLNNAKLDIDLNENNNPINNIPIINIGKYNNYIDKNNNNNKKININENYTNSNDEIDYYKKKCDELQMLVNVLKEGIKNILMKLSIPKKAKDEIKQILKLFEFSNDETLFLLGEKKK